MENVRKPNLEYVRKIKGVENVRKIKSGHLPKKWSDEKMLENAKKWKMIESP